MIEKVTKLKAAEPNNASVVKHLEDLLQEAKDGDLVDIAYAVTYTGNRTGHGWSELDFAEQLLGELVILQLKIASHRLD